MGFKYRVGSCAASLTHPISPTYAPFPLLFHYDLLILVDLYSSQAVHKPRPSHHCCQG